MCRLFHRTCIYVNGTKSGLILRRSCRPPPSLFTFSFEICIWWQYLMVIMFMVIENPSCPAGQQSLAAEVDTGSLMEINTFSPALKRQVSSLTFFGKEKCTSTRSSVGQPSRIRDCAGNQLWQWQNGCNFWWRVDWYFKIDLRLT